MTPEAIQAAVDRAISQQGLFPWWSYLLLLFISVVGAFLGAYWRTYVQEKGRNLATKEDIGAITNDIEKVRAEYSKESCRFEVLASGLLKKRAEAIERIYRLLVDTEEAFGKFVDLAEWKDDPSKDDLRKEAVRLLSEFLAEYRRNRIYFSQGFCDRLTEFSDLIYKVTIPYSIALTSKIEGDRPNDFDNTWAASYAEFRREIPVARRSIEIEFRVLLGMEEVELR